MLSGGGKARGISTVKVNLQDKVGVNGMNEQTFNGRFSSTKKPALLNEVWIKSKRDGRMTPSSTFIGASHRTHHKLA